MMVCYDGFFPEVARNLSNNELRLLHGLCGCNPMLGAARAVRTTFTLLMVRIDASRNWMIFTIYGHDGKPLAQAKD